MYGKSVSELQSNVVVGNSSISGTLHHVTDYTGFSEDTEFQNGNYLALKVTAPNSTSTTVEIVGDSAGPEELDSNMNWVGYISDTSQTIRVVTTDGTNSLTKTFSLTGLILETE